MKNKKWISLAAAVILAVTALPMTAFAAEKDGGEEKLTKVTLNEVAHSIFYFLHTLTEEVCKGESA